jgi:peptidoglycan hydrolase CwlO-like protein
MSTVDSVIYDELENLKQAVKELQAEVKALKEYRQERDALWAEVGRRLKETEKETV